MVWRVIKRIYGLKDAARGFWLLLDEELIKHGMERSTLDRALYFMKDADGNIIGVLLTHIDDILWAGTQEFDDTVIRKIKEKFVIGKEEESVLTFTGWNLTQDASGITLTQSSYTENLKLERFDNFKKWTMKDEEMLNDSEQSQYRQAVGILGWLCQSSRPNLAFQSVQLASKLGKATRGDAKTVLRVLEKAKLDQQCIKFSNLGDPDKWSLEVFCDAALGKLNDTDTVTASICFIKGENGFMNVIDWNSSKLQIPTASILAGEAEAAMEAHGKVKYYRHIFNEMFDKVLSATIFTDSKSLHAAVNSDNLIKNRRIAVAVATIRAMKEKENVDVKWISGDFQLANSLTKGTASPFLLQRVLSTGVFNV